MPLKYYFKEKNLGENKTWLFRLAPEGYLDQWYMPESTLR